MSAKGPKNALDVASAVLDLRRSTETSSLQVIKLVYLCHGWMLGHYGRRLMTDDVEAWRYGPVVPSVYGRYGRFGGTPIPPDSIGTVPEFDDTEVPLVHAVVEAYWDYSAWDLHRLPMPKGRRGTGYTATAKVAAT